MIDAKKLNDTVEELENEVENIKNISRLVEDIEKVSSDITINNEAYELVTSDIKLAKKEISKISNKNEVFLVDSKNKLDDINNTIDKSIHEIQNENIYFNKGLTKTYNEMEGNLLTQLQDMRNETKKLSIEIDELLTTRLERNKSDIQVEIRNNINTISTQIENDVSTKISEMNIKNENYNQEINEKMKKQNMLLSIIIVIGIINIILRFVKI